MEFSIVAADSKQFSLIQNEWFPWLFVLVDGLIPTINAHKLNAIYVGK